MNGIQYERIKGPYKFRLTEPYMVYVGIHPAETVAMGYLMLDRDGVLTIRAGYAWDGATGGIDTQNFIRGSLVHDALCQMMNEDIIPRFLYQEKADAVLRQICIEDGMSRIRAWWVYTAVRFYDLFVR